MRLRGVTAALVVALATLCAAAAWADAGFDRLVKTLRTDPAYKVRMQAIRVISKKLDQPGAQAPAEVIDGLGHAATKDDNHLVRGLACFALSALSDPRAVSYLERAKKDDVAFVRAQAEQALAKMRKSQDAGGGGRNVLVVATDEAPGTTLAPELKQALLDLLKEGFRGKGAGRFTVDEGRPSAKGYHMKGSVAQWSVTPSGDGKSQVTVVVKISVATWPENNLRHVVSARGSSKGSGNMTHQRKVLKAVVDKAVQDTMAEIGGG